MKIVIKKENKTKISLWFPTSVLKLKFVAKAIYNKAFKNSEAKPSAENFERLTKLQHELYHAIRKYKKQHGHLEIVEVETAKGEYVLIKL